MQTRCCRKKRLLNPPLQCITYIQFAKRVAIVRAESRDVEEVVYQSLLQCDLSCVYIQRDSTSKRVLYAWQGSWYQRYLAFPAVEKRPGQVYQIQLLPLKKLTISYIVSGIREYDGEPLPKFSDVGETLCSGDFRGRRSMRFRLTYSSCQCRSDSLVALNYRVVQTTEAIVPVN